MSAVLPGFERVSRPRRCKRCKAPLVIQGSGRPRLYCGDACKQAAHRKRNRGRDSFTGAAMSSKTDDWPTDPAYMAQLVERFGGFDLDPCADDENHKAPRYFTRADNGLSQEWTGRVFMNPPYGRVIGEWMRKAWESSQTTAELVVCLVPARVDTAWWHDYATRGEVEFIRGRLKFGDLRNSAPFPSALVVFRNAQAVT